MPGTVTEVLGAVVVVTDVDGTIAVSGAHITYVDDAQEIDAVIEEVT